MSFPALIDPTHTVTRLYGMVNVPSGVWIDEEGRIVRPPETAYSRRHRFGPIVVGDERYTAALRDWVARGAESEYALDAEELAARLAVEPVPALRQTLLKTARLPAGAVVPCPGAGRKLPAGAGDCHR